MPPIGVVEALLILALLVALVVVLVVLVAVARTVGLGGRSRRATPLDRMPDAWLEQHAMVDQITDRRET